MTADLAKTTRLLQAVTPLLIAVGATLIVFSLQDEAKNYPGPPFYLPFIFVSILAVGMFSIAALFLWVWRLLGWCLCVLPNIGVSSWAAWNVASDFLSKRPTLAVDATFSAIAIWFGSIAFLFFSRQFLEFCGITESVRTEPAPAS